MWNLMILQPMGCLSWWPVNGYYINQLNKSMSSKFLQLAVLLTLTTVLTALSCASNQYYVNQQTCANCPSNCSSCSNAAFCTSCLPNYFLVQGASNASCQTCSQIFVGCQTCISNVACTKCVDGYFASNLGCSLCSTKNLFCVSCSSDGNTCTQCAYPFILVKNACVSPTVTSVNGGGPSTPSSNSSGSTTPNTSTTVPTVTLSNGTSVPIVLDANGCNQIQIYIYGKCFNTIPNCNLYQTNGFCQFCRSGFLVTIFGDCSPSNKNLNCEDGYWLNPQNNSCVQVNPACDWYYPENGSCFNCSTGYTWANNTCVQNVACNSRQFFYSGTCITVPSECSTFSSVDGACTSCISGYILKGGLCTISQPVSQSNNLCKFPCKTCNESNRSFCYSCVIYYELQGARYGTCIPVLY